MVQLNPYLNFNGNAEEALNFYAKTLGGQMAFKMTWGESPMCKEMPAEIHGKLMHGSVCLGSGALIMGCDTPPERYETAKGGCTCIGTEDVEEAKRIYEALAEGGKVDMPFGPTFFSQGFGMLRDRFGIPWMVNCTKQVDMPAQA